MRIAGLFNAEKATVKDERLEVSGALYDGLKANSWPASHRILAVALLRPDAADVGVKFHFDFHVTGPQGQDAGHRHVDVVPHVHRPQIPVIVEVPATLPVAGEYTLAVRSGVGEDQVTFYVVGPEVSEVAEAVEGYALGLSRR